MAKDGRRSLGSNGDIGQGQAAGGMPESSKSVDKPRLSKLMRVVTVIAYVICVTTGAALLSAYYVFFWVPHPSDPIQSKRPTDSPFSLAQHGNTHTGGSYYHYPKNSYSNGMDSTKLVPPSRNKKSHYKTTVPPNFLPKPQYLMKKPGIRTTYETTSFSTAIIN